MFFSDLHHGLPRDLIEELRLRNEHLLFGRDQASHAVVTFFFCEQKENSIEIKIYLNTNIKQCYSPK